MDQLPTFLPVAVVAAVAIFLARELLDGVRRWKSNARKLRAIKRFLAVECERNNFAIPRLLGQIDGMSQAITEAWPITIVNTQRGVPRLRIETPSGESSAPVPAIHMAALDKYLFDAASLDARLFQVMETALDELLEAAHVREGVMEYVVDDPHHLDGFVEYAERELNTALDAVRALYFKCTYEPLVKTRVR